MVPHWADSLTVGHRMINARAETLPTRAAFRTALERRRCIIPADGFYEWKREGKQRAPFFIHPRDGELIGFAGLWDIWRSPKGESVASCTIITTATNELIAPLHDRMQVILDPKTYDAWLSPRPQPAEALLPLLVPAVERAGVLSGLAAGQLPGQRGSGLHPAGSFRAHALTSLRAGLRNRKRGKRKGGFMTCRVARRQCAGVVGMAVGLLAGAAVARAGGPDAVTLREAPFGLLRAVNIALNLQTLDQCVAADYDHDGQVGVAEIIRAVNAALSSCTV